MSIADIEARQILSSVFDDLSLPKRLEDLQGVQAIARYEGYYGRATKPKGWETSKNWGAIHADSSWKGETMMVTDSDLFGNTYNTQIKVYPTHYDAALDLVKRVRKFFPLTSQFDLADKLINSWYFGDPKKYPKNVIEKKRKMVVTAIEHAVGGISSAMGEPPSLLSPTESKKMGKVTDESLLCAAIYQDLNKAALLANACTVNGARVDFNIAVDIANFKIFCEQIQIDPSTGSWTKLNIPLVSYWLTSEERKQLDRWEQIKNDTISRVNLIANALKQKGVLGVDPIPVQSSASSTPILDRLEGIVVLVLGGAILYKIMGDKK